MSNFAVSPPYQTFNDVDGTPLESGFLYFGVANQNPETTPITIYWDEAGTIPAAQPIRTVGGYPVRNGSPAALFTPADFSLTVRNKNRGFVYSAASSSMLTSISSIVNSLVGGANGSEFIGFAQSGTGAVSRTVESKLRDFISIKDFGGVCDGVTNDAAALILALAEDRPVLVNAPCYISLDAAQAATFIHKLSLVHPEALTIFYLPSGEINVPGFVDLDNPDATKIDIRGVDVAGTTATVVANVGGVSTSHSIKYTLADSSNIDVGDYVIISGSSGVGNYRVTEGCFRVTAKAGNDITVKHTLYGTWPAFTFISASVRPVKTILRWPAQSVGLRIFGCSLRALRNTILAGSFNISASAPSDSAADGLQVGSVSNTYDTGLNESEQTNLGSIWVARVGIVEWEGNGVQVIGGKMYGTLVSSCSNGWRGFQAASAGSCTAKASSAIGNGASGYEAEGVGWMNADNSVAAGNWQQGVFCIGSGAVGALNVHAICNGTNGLDSRNFGNIQADGAIVRNNAANGVSNIGGEILFGSGAITTDNGIWDIDIGEGGIVNANGAANTGTNVRVDSDSNSILVDSDGDRLWPTTDYIEYPGGTHQFRRTITSIGDVIMGFGPAGSVVDKLTYKGDGTFFPNTDSGPTLGRSSNRWDTVFSENGVVTTSDEREKQQIRELTDAEKRVAVKVKGLVKVFKRNGDVVKNGVDAKSHVGVIAQQVVEAFSSEGLDAEDYGVIRHDYWDGGDRYGVIYEELLAFIITTL
jgi:hypothetical protein